MAATRDDISKWFDEGVEQQSAFMIIRCDTFDWEDYPSYHSSEACARETMNAPGEMQKVMEVYDLSKPRDEQLNMRRCRALT